MAVAHYCEHCLTTFSDDPSRCPNLTCRHDRPDHGWDEVLGQGDLLDRHYRIERALAVGGAGITYLARGTDAAGHPVPPDLAIKVLYAERDSGPFLRRLSTEAQILQELAHPHIVECRGFVHRTGQAPYLVTLFEPGGTLEEHVQAQGPLPPTIAAAVLDQVLDALDIAHQRGIVHRDLKPANLLLSTPVTRGSTPWVRVADFGIAKVSGGVTGGQTRLGTFVGTPEYASPEQYEGATPTAATDVWAAGGLLFFLLTGRPPVTLQHRTDLAHAYEELLDQVPPALPDRLGEARGRLQEILAHTLCPRPEDRWSVGEVRDHLAPLVQAAPTQPPARTTRDPASHGPSPTLAPPVPEPAPVDAPPPAGPALSWLGLLMILGIGALFSAGALGVGAWGMGWFGPSPTSVVGAPIHLPALVVRGTHPEPVPARGTQRRAIETALKVAAADLDLVCHPKGDVPLIVLVEPDGSVGSAMADPRVIASDPGARCVQEQVDRMTLPSPGETPTRLQITLSFRRR